MEGSRSSTPSIAAARTGSSCISVMAFSRPVTVLSPWNFSSSPVGRVRPGTTAKVNSWLGPKLAAWYLPSIRMSPMLAPDSSSPVGTPLASKSSPFW